MNTPFTVNQALVVRISVGLVFGLILAWLETAFPQTAKAPLWAQIVTSVVVLGPFVLWAGAGTMRRLSFLAWGVVALVLIALFAWNQDAHVTRDGFNPAFFNLGVLVYPFLFVANELVSSGDQARRVFAPYPLYFEEGSKRAVQLAVGILFTALFWGLLWMGAELLKLIGFTWFTTVLESPWARWPALYTAFGASVQLSDVQPKLVHGFRALILGVLSWLLPVITAIGVMFAVSLCFSGLEPLWKTKAATASLLAACMALAVLINAAWQDGDPDRKVHVVLRWSARAAAVLLMAFSVLAAVSLRLRIHQYGLTPERVIAAVGVFLAVLFGLAYAYAAVMPKGGWMARLGPLNVILAVIMAVAFLAVLTPLADPYRLSADSQAARVRSGAISPDKFDWRVLRFETGTWGRAKLDDLAAHARTADIRAAAAKAKTLTDDDRWPKDEPASPQTLLPNAFKLVYPKRVSIPADFMSQSFSAAEKLPYCATSIEDAPCTAAAVIDLDHDGMPEVLILQTNELIVMGKSGGRWHAVMENRYLSEKQQDDFKAGKISTVKHQFDDVRIGDQTPIDITGDDSADNFPPKTAF